MSVNAVELPAIENPLILAYLRVINTIATTAELQQDQNRLHEQIGQFLMAAREHFAKCDEVIAQQLLAERDDVGEQAKAVLRQINEMGRKRGLNTSFQSRLQSDLETAQRELDEFVPINRTISSLEQIAEDETEQIRLHEVVAKCKAAITENGMNIVGGVQGLKELQRQFDQLAAKEETIAKQIEELTLPPEQRKRRSSVIWQAGDGTTFGWQRP